MPVLETILPALIGVAAKHIHTLPPGSKGAKCLIIQISS